MGTRDHDREGGDGGAHEDGDALELRLVPGGARHFLADEPIHTGDTLEVLLENGRWLTGRYAWTSRPSDAPTNEDQETT